MKKENSSLGYENSSQSNNRSFQETEKMQMIRPSNDFDIFDVIKDNKINADEKMIKDQIFGDLNLLIDKLPSDQRGVKNEIL